MPDPAPSSRPQTRTGVFGIASMAILACALCDLGHELLGHGLATLLPLGVRAVSVSTIGLSTTGSSPIVAAAGPLLNLALACALLLAALYAGAVVVSFVALCGLIGSGVIALRGKDLPTDPERESLQIGRGWLVAGAVAAIVFIGVFGPGVALPLRP